jgi:tetratricopeptide (TPR) repeat protein
VLGAHESPRKRKVAETVPKLLTRRLMTATPISEPALGARLDEGIDFGELPGPVNDLLQEGVVAYRRSPSEAEARFRLALELAPQALPVYFCLYKIHTYQGNLDAALTAARAGLGTAAAQAGWPADFRAWPRVDLGTNDASRFALYTLKALAFIRLKRGELPDALEALARLEELDPQGHVGWPVIRDLARGLTS